jgi:hypothetical protein
MLLCLAALGAGQLLAETYVIVMANGTQYQARERTHNNAGMTCFYLASGDSELCFAFDQFDWYAMAQINGDQPPEGARRIYRYDDGSWGYEPPSRGFELPDIDLSGDLPALDSLWPALERDFGEMKSYLSPSTELGRYSGTTLLALGALRLVILFVTFFLVLFFLSRQMFEVSKLGLAFYMLVSVLTQLVYLEFGSRIAGWIGFGLLIMLVLDWLQWRFLGGRLDLDAGESIVLAKLVVILEVCTIALIWGIGYFIF